VRVDPSLAEYLVRLAGATRANAELSGGASTRGVLNVLAAARACALFDGRAHLLPDDLKRVAVACLAHRVAPSGREATEADRAQTERILVDLIERVPVPE
jgi:MoxR-like ATPase